MARIIDLEFNDRPYTIEYNRESVLKVAISRKDEDDIINMAVELITCGLMKHHKNEMPSREDIISWLFSLGDDLPKFVQALQDCVEDVFKVIESEQKSKNLKWGVRK